MRIPMLFPLMLAGRHGAAPVAEARVRVPVVASGTTITLPGGVEVSLADWVDDKYWDTWVAEAWWCGYLAVTRRQAHALLTSDTPVYRGLPVLVGVVMPDEMARAYRRLRRAERRVRRTGGGPRVAPHGQHRVILSIAYDTTPRAPKEN